jgi:PAS domain S-box-containing protein
VTAPEPRAGSPAAGEPSGGGPRDGERRGGAVDALSRSLETDRLRVQLAVEAAGIGSYDWDLVTGRLDWDDRLIALFGYDRSDFDHSIDAFTVRLHPDDRDRVAEALQTAIDGVGEYDAEYRVVLPDGRTRWVHGRGRTLADDRGTAVRFLGVAYDTTLQREGDVRLSRLLEAMKSAFVSLDGEWRFTYLNAEAERVLRVPRDEALGIDVWELFPLAVGSAFEQRFRAAVDSGLEQVFEAYYPAPLEAWFEVRAWPTPEGLSVSFLDISARRSAQERAERATARLALIAEVSSVMSQGAAEGSSEGDLLQRVSEALVPVLGDWVIATLVDEEGRMRDVGSSHVDRAVRPLVARYARLRLAALQPHAPVLHAVAAGHLRVVDDVAAVVRPMLPPGEVRETFDALAPRTAITMPLAARGRTLGALSIYRSAGRPGADGDDVATARDLAERIALALDNSRLYEQQRRLAVDLQRSLLTAPPEPDHAQIVVRYEPAVEVAEVGGDWYDAFLQPSGGTMLVIGDVVGHDTAAAAAMGQLRGMLRGIAYREGTGPAAVLTQLDAAIEGLDVGTMATAAIARIEQTPGERAAGLTRVRWSNAGHPPPLVVHHDGRVEALAGARAELMLGVDRAARRTESVVTVRRGSTLLLYTDGLVEARDLLLDEGIARLRAVLAEVGGLPLEELCDAVLDRLRPPARQDDVALVAIRLHPQDRPRPREAGPRRVPPGVDPE